MIDVDAALREELLQIAIRQPERQIPADRRTITSGGKRNPANPDICGVDGAGRQRRFAPAPSSTGGDPSPQQCPERLTESTQQSPADSVRSGCGEVVLQGHESVVPLVGERGEELLCELDGCGSQSVADSAALAWFGCDQAGVGHEGEVFSDRLAGDR